MFIRIAIIILTCFTLLSCNQKGKYYDPNQKDTSKRVFRIVDSSASRVQPVETGFNEQNLQLFCNNEITAYCVLLPLHEFKEDITNEPVVKAQHTFKLIQDPKSFTSIEVQGFTIDKKNNYNTALFYNRDKKDVEEGGLGIDSTYIDETNHFYLIKGYLPNYMNMKFVQLNWILEDRIAVYFNYDEKDEAIWKERIAAIIKRGVKLTDQ
jgi:hypothetical protein